MALSNKITITFTSLVLLAVVMAAIHAFSASYDRANRLLRKDGLIDIDVAHQYAYIGSCGWRGPVGHSFVARLRDNTLVVGVVCTDLWNTSVIIYK